jgi:hypothetical protein
MRTGVPLRCPNTVIARNDPSRGNVSRPVASMYPSRYCRFESRLSALSANRASTSASLLPRQLYKQQDPTEQRRLLETVLSNSEPTIFDCGIVRPHYAEPFDFLVKGNELEIGGESGIRTHGRVSPTHAFQACSFNHSDISPL